MKSMDETARAAACPSDRARVLVIDDDQAVCDYVARVLGKLRLPYRCAGSLEEARTDHSLAHVALIILDLSLGGCDAVDVLDHLADQDYTGGVMLITGYDIAALEPVQKLGTMIGLTMWPYLTKPVRPADLRRALAPLAAQRAGTATRRNRTPGAGRDTA